MHATKQLSSVYASQHFKALHQHLLLDSDLAHVMHTEKCMCCRQELRRGADPARIFSIAFSRGDIPQFVAVSSDKGTVHVFNLDPKRTAAIPSTDATSTQIDGNSPKNPVSALKFVSVSFLVILSLVPDGPNVTMLTSYSMPQIILSD